MADTNASTTCTVCSKPGSTTVPLKRCAKCKTQCKNAGESATNLTPTKSAFPRPQTLEAHIEKPFHQLHSKTWLHNRPENDVYQLLIDVYRMRMEDDYVFTGDADMDCIYGGAPDSRDGFRRFLRLAERKRGLLPEWWSPQKAKACVAFGLRRGDNWSSLACAVEKSDVLEHYKDPSFPMQLRMFGEQVWGTGPAGRPGAQMMQQMMQHEKGEIELALRNDAGFMDMRPR
ncbi:uncharacterized protein BO80DRAFT_479345 [Aspergillus ibericus CBS 121593]|uniref:Uncharacterized protein n=1 Tax=Aspergillus ibericus CBS 121593 TaxID=1448316 RepID=A0A395GT97_9EURO|nr:hypothetical protein BO80DRAFT_479345 [Aspergillus ibericus CBS 121593]RAK98811.1 hypothetical protein BO80DRAFT_479345 [Aspergillus ibericus CBS 121593]